MVNRFNENQEIGTFSPNRQSGFEPRQPFTFPRPTQDLIGRLPIDEAQRNRRLRAELQRLNLPAQTNLRFGASLKEQNDEIEAQLSRGPGPQGSLAGAAFGAIRDAPISIVGTRPGGGFVSEGTVGELGGGALKALDVGAEVGATATSEAIRGVKGVLPDISIATGVSGGSVGSASLTRPPKRTEVERTSRDAVLNLITGGGEGREAAFNTLAENFQDRTLLEQFVFGAVFDVLNVGIGVQAARRSARIISQAFREGKAAVTLKAAADTFESEARRLGITVEELTQKLGDETAPNLQDLFAAPRATGRAVTVDKVVEGAGSTLPTLTERNRFGIRPISDAPISNVRNVGNTMRRTTAKQFPDFATHLAEDTSLSVGMRAERERVRPIIAAQAARLSALARTESRIAFPELKQGNKLQIPSLGGIDPDLPGAPTLADVAAQLPIYRGAMNQEQVAFMTNLRDELAPYRAMFDDIGIDIGTRIDIIEGGFYIPRGNALEEGAEVASGVRSGFSRGRIGAERSAEFASQAAGIEAGFEYSSFGTVINSHINDVGKRVLDQHTVNFLKNAIDPSTGETFAKTSADFVPASLRRKHDKLLAQLSSRRKTLLRRDVRTRTVGADALRAERRAEAGAARATGAAGRLEQRLDEFSPQDLSAVRDDIRQNISESIEVSQQVGRDIELLKQASKELTTGERQIQKEFVRLADELADVNAELNRVTRNVAERTTESNALRNARLALQQKQREFDELASLTHEELLKEFGPNATPDTVFSAMFSTANRRPLRRGETFRSRGEVFLQNLKISVSKLEVAPGSGSASARDETLLLRINDDIARITDDMNDLIPRAHQLNSKVDDLIDQGTLDRGDLLEARNNTTARRRDERILNDRNRSLGSARRELRILEGESNRLKRVADSGVSRTSAAVTRQLETAIEVERFKKQIDAMSAEWQKAIDRSKRPKGRSGIPSLSGVNGHTFPDVYAASIEKVLRSEKPTDALLLQSLNAAENLLRGLRATGDMSASGIQGLVGLGSDPKAWGKAMEVSFKAWANEDVLGAYIRNFDEFMGQRGRLTSVDWAEFGLQIGGPQTEFRIGDTAGLTGKIGRAPVLKQANQAFGFFGDTLRLEWADDLLMEELSKGKTISQMLANGEVEQIARITNNMTGWTPGRAFGSVGDIFLFAPRFLQSRLETTAKAMQGLRPGATLEQRIATRSMVKMIGWGTLLTVGINEMLGNDTDFNPLRRVADGKVIKNPNFMRIRAFGRDFSLFGPWDSLAGAFISIGAGRPQDAARQFSSTTAGLTMDLVFGKDAIGNPTRDTPEQFLSRAMEVVVPFAAQEVPHLGGEVVGGVREGDAGRAFGGGLGLGAEFLGVKSSQLSLSERIDEARGMTSTQFRELLGSKQDKINEQPKVKALLDERANRNRERSSGYQDFLDDTEALNTNIDEEILLSERTLGAGGAFRQLLSGKQQERFFTQQGLNQAHAEDIDFFNDLDPVKSGDRVIQNEYFTSVFDPRLEDEITGDIDFIERNERDAAMRDKYGDDKIDEIIADTRRRPALNESSLAGQLRRDQDALRDYFAIPINLIKFTEAEFPNLTLMADYKAYLAEKDLTAKVRLLAESEGLPQVLELARDIKKFVREPRSADEIESLQTRFPFLEDMDIIGAPVIETLLRRWEYSPFNRGDTIVEPTQPDVREQLFQELTASREPEEAGIGAR